MKNSIFITGISGFIGRYILRQLDFNAYDHVFCLSRSQTAFLSLPEHNNLTYIYGDLSNSIIYGGYLNSTTTVLHLAALTGKAPPDEYIKVNVKGTQTLVDSCRCANIQHFIYISSIAVKYPKKFPYYYAQSKQDAEDIIRLSNLNYTIIRPTIVLGKEAIIWQHLLRLAKLPIIPLFGDGHNKIQPIYVKDLALCILALVNKKALYGQTIELGGPDIISFEDLLCGIRQRLSSKIPRRIHLSPKYLWPLLSLIESLSPSFLPFNVGQLSAFLYDSTIEPNKLFSQVQPQMKNISAILDHLILNHEETEPYE